MAWILVVCSALLGGALVAVDQVADPGPEASLGVLVGTWTEADVELRDWRVEPAVLDTAAERDAFIASAPATVRRSVGEVVTAVDLSSSVLVVGGYPNCLDHSVVGPGPSFVEVDDEPGTDCGWSPYTVDVHAVTR
jgi:hypothetical protein